MFKVLPIDLFSDTSVTYDQTKTSYIGRITTKTISGRTVVGPPIVKYRNTVTGPEILSALEIVFTDNNRLFAITAEASGIVTIAAYTGSPSTGDMTYIGKINITIPEPPTTTYAIRGFRVVDDGTTGWKIFILYTANVSAHAGLYMVDDIDLADFAFVPTIIPQATAPGQKAVYKLDNDDVDITTGTGIFLDKANGHVWVHRGLAATHSFIKFDYDGTITTVGALGATTDLFLYQTGNLPPLTGTLLLTNSEEYMVPNFGANNGDPCVIFHTSTFMYVGPLDELTDGATSWPSLEFANNQQNVNEFVPPTTLRATYAQSINKVVLLCSSSAQAPSIVVKEFANNQHDLYCTITANDNNEAAIKEMYKFKLPIAPIGFDSRLGYLAMISATTGVRGIYTACFDCDDFFDSTYIISPVIDVSNKIITRFTAGFVRPDLASPVKICYRTSGFGSASGGWIDIGEDLDFGTVVSPTGQIQIKISYRVFSNESTNALQIYSCGLVMFDLNATSDNWEYSHQFSTPNNPSKTTYRLKKVYATSVPTLIFRGYDLSNNLFVMSNTVADAALFEYSTDNGLNWTALGTIPNTVGTLVRYNYVVTPGIDLRPSLREF
jgi:hypothetical protein